MFLFRECRYLERRIRSSVCLFKVNGLCLNAEGKGEAGTRNKVSVVVDGKEENKEAFSHSVSKHSPGTGVELETSRISQ